MKARGDALPYANGPKDFKFYVSDNGINWTEVVSVTGQTYSSIYQELEWGISSYGKYVGLSVTGIDSSAGQYALVGELFIKGY